MAENGLPPGCNMGSDENRQAFAEIATIWKSWFFGDIDTDDIGTLEYEVQQRRELPKAVLRTLSYTAFETCYKEIHHKQEQAE